jgi:calpain-7
VLSGSQSNDCLITLGTGIIQDEDKLGLVGGHAYGVLEVFQSGSDRLMLLKNPWGHFSWKGKWCFGDKAWTPELKKALCYDNFSEDKGVFWMSFDAVCVFFESLHMNWNPDLLTQRKSFFDHWQVKDFG